MSAISNTLPTAALRKYLADTIRNLRGAIRRYPVTTNIDIIRKEKLEAQLAGVRFVAKDVSYFSRNPETLA